MQIDTAGTYTLKYTAEDECGNVTEVTREVVAEQLSYRTVLYTDGTFIINEKSSDQAANEALHGVATNVYDPFDPNGATNVKKYIFTSAFYRPWRTQASSVKAVEIGSSISPTNTAFWFQDFTTCTSMNLGALDTSAVTNMGAMFGNCQALTSLDVTHFDTSAVTNMGNMFSDCYALTSLDVSGFNTSSVTNMGSMFNNCHALTTLDVTHFDTSSVTNMSNMFSHCHALTTLDVTHFNTSAVTNMGNMFGNCYALTTIYASIYFVVTQVTNSNYMFTTMSTNLVGGAGTRWASGNPQDKTYARIDNPPDAPGYFTLKSA